MEIQNVQRNMEQKQMVDWVIRSVEAAVTPAQEKAALTQCIASIKALAKENTARIWVGFKHEQNFAELKWMISSV